MAGLDVASGIAGLISLALEVTGAIVKYSIAVREHSRTIRDLEEELRLLITVLGELNEFIESEKAKHRSFEKNSVLSSSIGDCKQRIQRVLDKVKISDGGKIARTIDKLKWPFEQKEVIQLVDNLRRYTQTFQFALTIKNSEFLSETWDGATKMLQDLQRKVDLACETHKMLGEPIEKLVLRSQELQQIIDILPQLLQQSEDIKEVTQAVRLAEQREQEKRKTDILEWLTPLSTLHKHVELQNRRALGTCKWLLESEVFAAWADLDSFQCDMLCQGGPGVGKSVLCSLVTDYLRKTYKNADVAVVYYYFDLAEQQSQTEYSFAKSILRQLCQSIEMMPIAVAEFYQRTRNELQDTLWLQELRSILQRVIATFSHCFIVIDALDEIDRRKLNPLVEIMTSIRDSNEHVKFFVTSRPHVNLESFQNALQVDVRADNHDLRTLLGQKIDAHQYAKEMIDGTLREDILNQLCSHADGVFLLPALQIDQILDQAASPGDIERALRHLSTDLKEVFQSTITRIESFSGGKRNLAFKTLLWISHARRPLRISELRHAIAVRFDKADINPRDISSISVIIDSCCGLVELDGETASVRFVHGSIAEYLRSQDHGFFQNADLEIVKVCLKYLSMDQLKTIPFKSRYAFSREMENYPLLDYASSFWGFHARGLDVGKYQDLAWAFLNSSLHLHVSARVRDLRGPEMRKWQKRILAWSIEGGAGISAAADFGLADLIRFLISRSQNPVLNTRNMYGSTPLHVCAMFGYIEAAEVLIAHKADLLDSNTGKATPFYLAVSYGQLEMCRTLIKYERSQLNVPCKDGNTALHKAADLGSDAMVEFLLQSGAKADACSQQGMTPLHFAARNGYLSIARMLILAGAPAHAVDHGQLTPLHLAATRGHAELTQYLLLQGALVDHKAKQRWTPLHRAARAGHLEVVQHLLAAGADVLAQDRQKSIPFQLAVKSGNIEAVKAILYHSPALCLQQLRHRDWKHDKAIDISFYTASYHIYIFLRDIESQMALSDDSATIVDPLLPLTRAIEQGQLQKVRDLLQVNPQWLEAKDLYNQSALHTAFRAEQPTIAEYLLVMGASIDSRGYHGYTPLLIASSLGSLSMLSLALQWNADITLTSDSQQSPLHKAASSHSVPVVIELLRCGCDPGAVNTRGMTPVHVAAHHNFLGGILAMIRPEYGSRSLLFTRDNHGRIPRDWADATDHSELSLALRDEELRAKGRLGAGGGHGAESVESLAMNNSTASLPSRQATRESLDRRSTTSSLLPSLERSSTGMESTSSFPSAEGSSSLQNSGHLSPARTPDTSRSITSTPTPLPLPLPLPSAGSMADEIERKYARMVLEFDSD